MKNSTTFNWFSSILVFIFSFSILIYAAPAQETDAQNRDRLFPNYIFPIYEKFPEKTSISQKTGDIYYSSPRSGDRINLIVGFDIPVRSGGVCYIQFTLPKKGTDNGGYNWIVTGSGKIEVYSLDSESDFMDGDFSWDNRPERVPHTPIILITQPQDGGEASVSGQGFSCEPGSRVYLELVIPYRAPGSFHWYELKTPRSGITMKV